MNRTDATKALDDLTADFEKNAAALRAIIEAPEKPTRRDWREEDLRAGLRFKNDQREFRELQEPNLDKKAYAPGWRYGEGTGNWDQSTYIVKCLNNRDLNPNLDPDIHGANPSEDARLWLESFVPVYGLTVPSEEVLKEGWTLGWTGGVSNAVGFADKASEYTLYYLRCMYLQGTWHPTREAAEAWLERFGKVRGFTK